MVSTLSEYKGYKVIELKRDENREFSFKFGVQRAELILDNLDKIKEFVEGDT